MRKIDASFRIIKIFKMLYEKPLTITEIIDSLYKEDIVVSKETLIKYFKTIRQSGCILRKKQGKFILESVPLSLELLDNDYENLAIFENLTTGLYGENVQHDLKNAIKKILSLADKDTNEKFTLFLTKTKYAKQEPRVFKEKISTLLKYGYDNSKIKILYNGEKIVISHISFKYYNNSVYVHGFNESLKNYELYSLSNIKEIYSTPETSSKEAFAPYTVFEIRGRLMKTYTLYEEERVIKVKNDAIVISNNYEDKKQLYKRLLRYGNLCKIISTQSDIENFKAMLLKMKTNLLNGIAN